MSIGNKSLLAATVPMVVMYNSLRACEKRNTPDSCQQICKQFPVKLPFEEHLNDSITFHKKTVYSYILVEVATMKILPLQ